MNDGQSKTPNRDRRLARAATLQLLGNEALHCELDFLRATEGAFRSRFWKEARDAELAAVSVAVEGNLAAGERFKFNGAEFLVIDRNGVTLVTLWEVLDTPTGRAYTRTIDEIDDVKEELERRTGVPVPRDQNN